ncbi:LOW QUALITY PROTEIN: max-binding protein MNT [Periophthalmus magnuspinnatus]|uniref:LOW QUALITY PROTEIN: max-binding protein MNT n=1 Tax=Periophthalmus magnuspinnatus TaxID=409849 RepID=UPI00145A6CA5|nr:LOW QUALITY PROTEIN: max-binding protein MNT [Periophthalmus magnuspinnatus]
MSIETLLEAAKFLELQALQQQKAREDEFKEKLLREQKTSGVIPNSTVHCNNITKAQGCHPALIQPPMPPASVPITVIPIPVVTPSHSVSPSLPVAPLPSTKRESLFNEDQNPSGLPCSPLPRPDHHPTSAPSTNHKQPLHNHQHHFIGQTANTSVQQQTPQHSIHRYTGSIVSPSPSQAVLPQSGTLLQHGPILNGSVSRSSPLDDSRLLDSKKRPGGAGTREVHNKLEKNRRAHLKECFETLRKNIPNVDEKKTSNLSVLRSALRYIQTLKRKEKEYEHDMERLAREKIATQQRLAELKNDLSQWMDVVEIDRVLRQTVQPEEDQASTSTASEGEDILDDDLDDEMELEQSPSPAAPQVTKPELQKTVTPPEKPAQPSSPCITQHKAPPPTLPPPQPLLKPALTQTVTATISSSANSSALIPKGPIPALHPTVIAHSSVSHPSVIQTLNHVIQTPKHITHLAPPTSSGPVHLTPAQSPISHITVHPVTHLPALYSQPVAVTQPGIVGHITHTLNHAHPHLNGTATSQPSTAAIVGKQTTMGAQMVTHHTQLVGQTVLNPVTMVTMPSSFPISILKLA